MLSVEQILVFDGGVHPELTREICRSLHRNPGRVEIGKFPDEEERVRIGQNIRGRDIFIITPTVLTKTQKPAENLMSLLIFIDAAKRASAGRVTAVIPYFGYGRQDWKKESRSPISARLVAKLIEAAGADRVLTVDLHAPQIQGFFSIPVDHLFGAPILIRRFREIFKTMKKKASDHFVLVAPDAGAKMVRKMAKKMGCPFALIDAQREGPRQKLVTGIVGLEWIKEGRTVAILDDVISTATTAIEASEALVKAGAPEVWLGATHGLFSGNALERLSRARKITRVVVTNTIPLRVRSLPRRFERVNIAPHLAEVIRRIHNNESISDYFAGQGY